MLTGYVTGDAAVTAKFAERAEKLPVELRAGIGRLAIKLQRAVKEDKLSGQALKVRTGTLRRSIDEAVIEEGRKVVGVVSTNVSYAKAHEYGFHGTVNVRAHLRTIKQAFGRPIDPVQVSVAAHSMKVNLPARSFLRSALADMEAAGTVRAEMEAALARAIA